MFRDMLGNYVCSALYTLLCVFLSVVGLIRLTCSSCIRCLFVNFDKYKPSSSQRLRKLPVHLGLVFTEDELFIVDVARIVAWSLVVGISCVTVYDHKGRCRLREEELKSNIAKETSHITRSSKSKMSGNSNDFHKEIPLIGSQKLYIIGPEDGQKKIVKIARKICNDVKNNQMPYSDIDIPFVDALMQGESGFPDPDLVFRFGSMQSMTGYLPWQLRLTEILLVKLFLDRYAGDKEHQPHYFISQLNAYPPEFAIFRILQELGHFCRYKAEVWCLAS